MTHDERIPIPAGGSPRSEGAYQALLPEILAVGEEQLVPILIDIPRAVTTVLGALPRIRALRPEIVEQLPRFGLAEFDKLERYTLALSHAHALHRAAHGPTSSLATMARELTGLRRMLLSDARSLASHGLVEAARLRGCGSTPGYRALAYDVAMLVALLKEVWNEVQERTPVTLCLLYAAAAKAETLLAAVGLRDQSAPTVAQATTIRRKAFSLFLGVYARARTAVQYLRAEVGDADEIAPSLYAGRVKARRPEGSTPEPGPAGSEPEREPGATLAPPDESTTAVAAVGERPTPPGDGAGASSGPHEDTPCGFAPLFAVLRNGRAPPPASA